MVLSLGGKAHLTRVMQLLMLETVLGVTRASLLSHSDQVRLSLLKFIYSSKVLDSIMRALIFLGSLLLVLVLLILE